jgi:hypothetical protein
MTLSAEKLLAIASNYWDSSKDFYLRQETSPRTERLQAAWSRELEDVERWWSFQDDLQRSLPGFELKLMGSTADAGFRLIAYPILCTQLPRYNWSIVGCISILAPVYAVYAVAYEDTGGKRSHFNALFEPALPGMDFPVRVISKKIEETFGFSALSSDIARTPVPLFVESKEPPHTTLFHVLFTSEPTSIP